MRLLLLFLGLALGAFSQVATNRLLFVVVDPSGACALGGPMEYNYVLNTLWGCVGSVWTQVTSGGGTAAAPYVTTTITASPMAILATTHNQSTYGKVICFDGATPRAAESCLWTRAANGDISVLYSVAPSLIEVYGAQGGGVGFTSLTGDVTGAGNGAVATTIATVNAVPGSCGDATHICVITSNAKGQIIDQTQVSISAGGGGSVFTGSTAVASAFSATGTYSLADVSVKSPLRFEPGVMTANVTSVTFTNKTAGAKFSMAWLQGASGYTVSYGASATNTCAISPTASITTTQFFEVAADGSTVVGTGCVTNEAGIDRDTTVAAPGTPAANSLACWNDSTDNDRECKDSSAVIYKMVKSGVDVNPVTGIVSRINGTAFAGTSGNLVAFGASNIPADAGFLATNVFRKDTTNAGAAAATIDLSLSTAASAFKMPVKASISTLVNGALGYDATTNMIHAGQSSADAMIPQFTVTPTDTHCANWVVVGGQYKLGTAGAACGTATGVTSIQGQTGVTTLFNKNAQTSTYQILAADFNLCKTLTVASGTFTATLVDTATQPADGRCVRLLNYGSGVVTLARSGQNINGAAADLTLAAGSASAPTGVLVTSDGTNYFAQPLGASSGSGPTTNQNIREIIFAFDGGGAVLSGGMTRCRTVMYAGTINGVYLISDVSGSITVDIKTVAHTSYTGPASTSSITAAAIPALSSAVKYSDTTLTGWTTSVTALTTFCAVMSAPATVSWAELTLKVAAN